ncbi:MAG: PEP-CTERM sorting domain-containing protein [Gloeocapsa sp. DLM2.Bin57]|nr:MAG: PEP-CTERM sorting domain-containing protein [Gloeocapsa sp. DLM2.Bin57]
MKKLNNHFSQAVILGVAASTTLAIAPVQAQTVAPPPFRGPGAAEALAGCPNDLIFPQKCDPNADVVVEAESISTAGLEGTVNFVPLEQPGGVRLEATDFVTPDGAPLTNIDFVPPEREGRGALFTVNTGAGSDFAPFQAWTGPIKDLYIPGTTTETAGAPFPNPANPRVRDFIRITQPPTGGSSIVEVNGIQVSGFAMDLNLVEFPIYSTRPTSTTISLGLELQGYLLDTQGRRIEEQFPLLPPETIISDDGLTITTINRTNVFANQVSGALTATFPNEIDGVPLRERLTQEPPLTGFGFDLTLRSTPNVRLIEVGDQEVIPEPTTILSSLLLFGGGAFKLKNRKRS